MKTNVERLKIALEDTLRLQGEQSTEYQNWLHGPRESPLPPGLPMQDGSFYPTTDRAVRCISEIVDDLLANDKELGLTIGKEAAFQHSIRVLGHNLAEIVEQPDERSRWKTYRSKIRETLASSVSVRAVYLPVWLFVRQEYERFAVGPVEFFDRRTWLDKLEVTEGLNGEWRKEVEAKWFPPDQPLVSGWFQRLTTGLSRSFLTMLKAPVRDATLGYAVNTISRFATGDQRIACVEVSGFDQSEAERRGLLATRVALDTVRLLVPAPHRARIFTVADHGPPITIDRLSQVHGKGLTAGWQANYPGVGGAPNMARNLIEAASVLFEAAGNCIRVVVTAAPSLDLLPALAQRWNNAVHWYGRACVADEEFVALPMYGFAMDILSDGNMEAGIRSLACALLDKKPDDPITQDGTTLAVVVRKIYEYRSKIAHGSLLAVDLRMNNERALAASFANAMLFLYVVRLDEYRKVNNPLDSAAAFLRWLQLNPPLTNAKDLGPAR